MTCTQNEYKYDIALSFAGEQRDFVEAVVRELDLPRDRVFYDADYTGHLWGEELSEVLVKLYRDEARYVVMFISREYAQKEWCILERRAALRRRMTTQGAYILPVRLDTTTLDEVEGLLGTIGYLDGLRLGVPGIVDAIRQKLGLALSKSEPPHEDDGEQRFGEVQTTQQGLAALVQQRPHSWQWAAFASVLVQRRAALRDQLRDHSLGYAPPNGQRVADISELATLVANSMRDVDQNSHQLASLVETAAFKAAFGEPNNLSNDPDAILHVANRVMDHYTRYLQIAQRVRGVAASSEYINILDTSARLSDKPIAGMDEFIDKYVKVVAEMPELLKAAGGEDIVLPIELPLSVDSDLLELAFDQLNQIAADAEAEDED